MFRLYGSGYTRKIERVTTIRSVNRQKKTKSLRPPVESQQPMNKQKTFVFWKFTRSRFPEHVIYYIDICMKWLQFNKVYQRVYIKNSECLQLNHIYFGSNNGNYFNEKENKILMIDDRFHCCFLRSCSPTIFGLIGIFFGHTDCAVLASVERVYEWVSRQTDKRFGLSTSPWFIGSKESARPFIQSYCIKSAGKT